MFILHTLLLSAALISRLTNITSSQNRSYSFVKVIRQSRETQLTVSRDVRIDKWAKSQIAGGCIPQTYRYILKPVYCYRLFGGQLTAFFIWLKPSTLFSSLLLWNSAASCVRGTYAPPRLSTQHTTTLHIYKHTNSLISPQLMHMSCCSGCICFCQERSKIQWGHLLQAESSPHLWWHRAEYDVCVDVT